MKATLLILCLLLFGALFAIGTTNPDEEIEQPVDEEASAGTGETLGADETESRMLIGEMRRKYGKWFIETDDDMIQLIIPDVRTLTNLGLKLDDRDEVILHGKFVDDRFDVKTLEKDGVKYTLGE